MRRQISLLSVVLVLSAGAAAVADQNSQSALYQGTAHVNWTGRDGEQGLHMVTEADHERAALVYSFPATVQANSISFCFERFERGILLTATTYPIVQLEYESKGKKAYWLIRPESMRMKLEKPQHRTIASITLHQVDGADPRIDRIAIIATCKRRKKVVFDYGDMDVWGLKLNDKPMVPSTVLAPKKDNRSDQLINVDP